MGRRIRAEKKHLKASGLDIPQAKPSGKGGGRGMSLKTKDLFVSSSEQSGTPRESQHRRGTAAKNQEGLNHHLRRD